jgi:hypothetical protein
MAGSRRLIMGLVVAVAVLGLIALVVLLRGRDADRRIEAELNEAVEALRPFPRRIDDATEILEARAEGRRMIYVFRVTQDAPLDIEQQRIRLRRTICGNEAMRRSIGAGVTFIYDYRGPGEAWPVLGRIEISECG